VRDISPESPEERRKHPHAPAPAVGWRHYLGPGSSAFEVLRRTFVGVYNDGFIHAGNLAYLTLLTLFPFFIVIAAITQLIGKTEENMAAISALLVALPPSVAVLVEATAREVLTARTGPFLWFGALVGLWTVSSFIETIREILRRAYGTDYTRPFWQNRLIGIAIVFASVALLMTAFSAQILLTAGEELIVRFVPAADRAAHWLGSTRFIPVIATFIAIFLMLWTLTPTQYRAWAYPKWPGAAFATAWWYGALTQLPRAIEALGGYALTYGGLAGVMIALLFFWLVGYGLVIGAHFNAALADSSKIGLKSNIGRDDMLEATWLDT
jgi:membrane protein